MPNPALLAALVSGVAGLAGQGLASWTNFLMQKNANKTNIQLANEQYARQRADIAAMNAYNSPAAQVVRLRAAGLSPAMMYGGSGATVAGQQSSVPSYDRASVQAPQFDASAIASTMADMSKLPSEILFKNQQTKWYEKQTEKLAVDIDFALKNNPQLLDKAKYEVEAAKQNVDNLRQEFELKVANTKLANINVDKIAQDMDIDVVNLMMAITKFPHELLNLDADTALKEMQKYKANQDVLLGWACLNEQIRHNQESEYNERGRNTTYRELGFAGQDIERARIVIDADTKMNTSLYGLIFKVAGALAGQYPLGRFIPIYNKLKNAEK